MTKKKQHRYALTLGEQSEIHVGCPIIGEGLAEEGYTISELKKINKKFKKNSKLIMLSDELPEEKRQENQACVLHIENGVNIIMKNKKYADRMLKEQDTIKYDKYYYDNRKKKKLNKIARHNIVFNDKGKKHTEDYKQSTVIAYKDVPYFEEYRDTLDKYFGKKARKLNSEGNFYYDEKSGIGFHGDSERKIVICCSLGTPTTLRFYWRSPNSSEVYKKPIDIELKHGDIYIMSEKASGYDWKRRSKYRLVHGAGNEKYIKVETKKDDDDKESDETESDRKEDD